VCMIQLLNNDVVEFETCMKVLHVNVHIRFLHDKGKDIFMDVYKIIWM
jgi:hypothetical protein